jgi:hypothetical protein
MTPTPRFTSAADAHVALLVEVRGVHDQDFLLGETELLWARLAMAPLVQTDLVQRAAPRVAEWEADERASALAALAYATAHPLRPTDVAFLGQQVGAVIEERPDGRVWVQYATTPAKLDALWAALRMDAAPGAREDEQPLGPESA